MAKSIVPIETNILAIFCTPKTSMIRAVIKQMKQATKRINGVPNRLKKSLIKKNLNPLSFKKINKYYIPENIFTFILYGKMFECLN